VHARTRAPTRDSDSNYARPVDRGTDKPDRRIDLRTSVRGLARGTALAGEKTQSVSTWEIRERAARVAEFNADAGAATSNFGFSSETARSAIVCHRA